MASIAQQLARNEMILGGLMSKSPEDRSAAIAEIQKLAEEASRFKKGQLIRARSPAGLSLVGGIHEIPHESDDPSQYFNSRVLGWDCLGRIDIATGYGDNPHCGHWPWSDDMLFPRDEKDWAEKSAYKPGAKVVFEWDLEGFDWGKKGALHRAVLLVPHIEIGDWYVEYEKPDGSWITRVLNEKSMRSA